MKHDGDCDTDCNWCTWNKPQRIGKGTERHGLVETIQTTELLRSARILRRVMET